MAQPDFPSHANRSDDASSAPEPAPVASIVNEEPTRESKSPRWLGVVLALLVIALLFTGFSLRSERQRSAALEADIAVLRSEVARAEANVSAHEARLQSVRAEVGDLLSRVGALNTLVQGDVVPEDALRAPYAPPGDAEAEATPTD